MSSSEKGGRQAGRCSHAGQAEEVPGPVLQGGQLGHLLQLLLAGLAGRHAAEEALQVVGQDLQGSLDEGQPVCRASSSGAWSPPQ